MKRSQLFFAAAIGALATTLMPESEAVAQTSGANTAEPGGEAAPQPVSPAGSEICGEDVICVTARRTLEDVSKVPVSVAVLSADMLAKANIATESDLRSVTPGLTVRALTSGNELNYSIRGQTQDAYANTRPGVLPYINEVQIGGTGSATAFYDLSSVQVLKGPQGTLFGRSATGGAVLFQTTKPDLNKVGGYGSLLGGNFDAFKGEGAINLPVIAGTAAIRVAGFYSKRDGYQRNLLDFSVPGGAFNAFVPFVTDQAGNPYSGPGGPNYAGQNLPDQKYGNYRRAGVRGSASISSGGFTNDLVADYYHASGRSVQPVLRGFNPNAIVPIQFIPAFAPALAAALAAQQTRSSYVVNTDGNSRYKVRNLILINTSAVDLGGATLKNIFGYTKLKNDTANEVDGTILPISENEPIGYSERIRTRVRQLSDELQISGSTPSLKYVGGLYFSSERNATPEFPSLFFAQILSNSAFIIRNKTYAAYGQATYNLGDSGFSLTGGVRYTSEKVSKSVLPTDGLRILFGDPAPPGLSYDKSRTFKKLSWTVGAQYQANPNNLFYVTSRRAYKSGGFNGSVVPINGNASIGGDSYNAMHVTDIEAGWKFKGHLGGMPAHAELDGFYDWVDDDQRVIYSNIGTLMAPQPVALTTNVPKATVKGIEFSAQISPASGLSIGGTAVYTGPKFGKKPVAVIGAGNVIYDQVPDTPKYVGTLFVDYSVPVSGDLSLLAHGDVYHQSHSFISPRSIENNDGASVLPKYTIVNFRLGIENKPKGWSLIANLKNAFNKRYFVGGIPVSSLYAPNLLVPSEPRTVTLDARYKF